MLLVLGAPFAQYDVIADWLDKAEPAMTYYNNQIAALQDDGDPAKIAEFQGKIDEIQANVDAQFAHLEEIVGGIATSIEQVVQKQDMTIEKLEDQVEPNDWERIKSAWQDYRSGKRTLKDILWSATKELGRKAFQGLIYNITGGIIEIALDAGKKSEPKRS